MYRSLLFCLGAALFLFAGCSEDSPTNNNNNVPTDFSFSVKINGTTWKADSAIYRTPALPTFEKEIVAQIGEEGLGEKITIMLNQTAPGTYSVGGSSNPVSIQYVADLNSGTAFNPDSAPATAGTVTIVESNDQYISGTFSFTATGLFSNPPATYNGAEGAFKVKAE